MKILLIRHGLAEPRDLNKLDHDRQLTDIGRQQLAEQAHYLVSFLENKTVQLISSPLVRAQQTAAIFTLNGLNQFILKNFAATGNLNELQAEIKKRTAEVIVVVGHSPHLEEWAFHLTGERLKVKKGAAIAIEILDFQEISGRVLWNYPLKQYDQLMKFTEDQDLKLQFKQEIEEIVSSYISMIKEQRKNFLDNPEQPETIHKLRVKIRQFRSFVSFLQPLMSQGDQKKTQKMLRGMARNCAYLRELDVVIETWQGYEHEFEKHDLTGQKFLKVLKSERQLEAKRLVEVLEEAEFLKNSKWVQGNLKKAIKIKNETYKTLNDMVQNVLKKWHVEMKNQYDAISSHDPKAIHALRIRAKKIRYLVDILELEDDREQNKIHEKSKDWQDVLGDMTDANRNPHVVVKLAENYPNGSNTKEIDLFVDLENRRAEYLYESFFVKHK